MSNKFKSLGLAALMMLSGLIANITSTAKAETANRSLNTSNVSVKYSNRVYSNVIKQYYEAYKKGIMLENLEAVDAEVLLNADLDTAYNSYEIGNMRFPFDGLTQDEVKAETSEAIRFSESVTKHSIQFGIKEGLPSTIVEEDAHSISLRKTEDMCERMIDSPKDTKIWDEVFVTVRSDDRYANPVNVEMYRTMLVAYVEPLIPANYLYTEPETGYLTPALGYRIRAIDKNGEEISILFFAADEEGNTFEEWSFRYKSKNTPISELRGYLQRDGEAARIYTLYDLRQIDGRFFNVILDEETNELLAKYGLKRDLNDVETKAKNAMAECIEATAKVDLNIKTK